MDKLDQVFAEQFEKVKAFAFDEQVVNVFPDMIRRSVPGYETILKGIAMYAMKYLKPGDSIYDLGASLGGVALTIDKALGENEHVIHAIDSSSAMIQGLQLLKSKTRVYNTLNVVHDRIQNIDITDAGMVVSNFTLQFIRPEDRVHMLQKIYSGLTSGGVFVLSEKIKSDQFLIDHYHGYKKINGYSDTEIVNKREALEGILIPQSPQQWEDDLSRCGFTTIQLWFQAFNFVSWVCIKSNVE